MIVIELFAACGALGLACLAMLAGMVRKGTVVSATKVRDVSVAAAKHTQKGLTRARVVMAQKSVAVQAYANTFYPAPKAKVLEAPAAMVFEDKV